MEFSLDTAWFAHQASKTPFTGEELSSVRFPTSSTLLKAPEWLPAIVPGTVLTTLVHNGILPDPFFGLNNKQNVPDISTVGSEFYTYWFCNKFLIDVQQISHKAQCYTRIWLNFRGINYSARIFLNGTEISVDQPRGMFLRRHLDVTHAAVSGGENHLAVLVNPPDHPGNVEKGGQGGDHDIAKDVTAQFVEGWDWMIPIADRNTGIWDTVSVRTTGPVTIRDPHLVSMFPDSDFSRANLHISTELLNTAELALTGTITAMILAPEDESTTADYLLVEAVQSERINVPAGHLLTHTFNPIQFQSPKLWWPNGMGGHPLYRVEISVEIDGYGESDNWHHLFGFRKIGSTVDPKTNGRLFTVNDSPVFVRGGNWIASDGMMRLSRDRYETEIGFHEDGNMNMLRVWGGSITERPQFYHACDAAGIMVWQEFWVTGDCNGRGLPPSDPTWPLDHALFLESATDAIKMLRNHASLAIWVGGNETKPSPDLNLALTHALRLYPSSNSTSLGPDPTWLLDGTRCYVPGSLWEGFGAGDGAWSDGPYGILNPEDFFQPGFYKYGFNPEIGSVGFPEASTVRKVMGPEYWDPPKFVPMEGTPEFLEEVANDCWAYHTYIPYSQPGKVQDQIALYGGVPADLDDFCQKAQIVNYDQYRALVESWNSRMWRQYTGVLIWKTQNPWPGFRGQLYDWTLDVCGGLFGVKSAAEPVHVQYNLYSHFIEVVNSSRENIVHAAVQFWVYGIDGQCVQFGTRDEVQLDTSTVVEVAQVLAIGEGTEPRFLLLKLVDENQSLLSRNFYWLRSKHGTFNRLAEDFRADKIRILSKASGRITGGNRHVVRLTMAHEHGPKFHHSYQGLGFRTHSLEVLPKIVKLAFFLRISVQSSAPWASNRTAVSGVRYSDNYISLVSTETVTVELAFCVGIGEQPVLCLTGWNVEPQMVDIHYS